MVRLVSANNETVLAKAVTAFFKFQQHFTHIVPVNFPNVEPCIYAMWHNNQCCVYGLPNKNITNVMVSRSRDGDIVATAIEQAFGFKTIRGSKVPRGAHKMAMGAAKATLEMVEALKNGENGAMMVDGPRGPIYIVKNGIIKIAKLAGVPIVPVVWYSDNFNLIKLKSWDRLQVPFCDVRLINLYGEPISVPQDADEQTEEECRLKLEESLLELRDRAPEEYKKVYWHGLWRRKI